DEFLEAIGVFLKKMPDYRPVEVIDQIREKSSVHPPGVDLIESSDSKRTSGPVRILWAARWEHDKNPEDFFAAMKVLKQKGLAFRLNVIGEQFRQSPEVFDWAKEYFADEIDRWGYQASKQEYQTALAGSDIVVSTAIHEFFGIGMLEAISAGCLPVLPERLSYPAIVESLVDTAWAQPTLRDYLYDGTVKGLIRKLEPLMKQSAWAQPTLRENINQYDWAHRARQMDAATKEI
ncbi:MAG: glycosyltransferase, partial [Planctomycetota bacterium]